MDIFKVRDRLIEDQEAVNPLSSHQDLARLGVKRNMLRETVEALRKPFGHGDGEGHFLGCRGFPAVPLGEALSGYQSLARQLTVINLTLLGPPYTCGEPLASGETLRLAAPFGDLAMLAAFGRLRHSRIIDLHLSESNRAPSGSRRRGNARMRCDC